METMKPEGMHAVRPFRVKYHPEDERTRKFWVISAAGLMVTKFATPGEAERYCAQCNLPEVERAAENASNLDD